MQQQRNEPWDRRPWMKFYTNSWLHGSIHIDCTLEERAVFIDLLALANESRNRGIIQANFTTPYSHSYLAEEIHIPLNLLEKCLKKFEIQDRIHENEIGIKIINFDFYNPPTQHTGKRGRPPKIPEEQLPLETLPKWVGEPSPKAAGLWKKALQLIEQGTSKANYHTWYEMTVGLAYDGDKFVVGVPNDFIGEYLKKSQVGFTERSLSEITKKKTEAEFQIYVQTE